MNNKKEINILFLGGGKRVSIAQYFKQYGEAYGIKINIFSYELIREVPIAIEGEIIIGMRWNEKGVIEDLKRVICQKRIAIVLPFVDPSVEVASHLKTECNSVFIPVSEVGICNVMFDKILAAHWFAEHQIGQPIFYEGKITYVSSSYFETEMGLCFQGNTGDFKRRGISNQFK